MMIVFDHIEIYTEMSHPCILFPRSAAIIESKELLTPVFDHSKTVLFPYIEYLLKHEKIIFMISNGMLSEKELFSVGNDTAVTEGKVIIALNRTVTFHNKDINPFIDPITLSWNAGLYNHITQMNRTPTTVLEIDTQTPSTSYEQAVANAQLITLPVYLIVYSPLIKRNQKDTLIVGPIPTGHCGRYKHHYSCGSLTTWLRDE